MTITAFVIISPQGRITISKNYVFNLGATGFIEVMQNLGVILATRLGTVILDRKLGSDQNYTDAPMPAAQQMMVASAASATRQEPRATFKQISFAPDLNNPGAMICYYRIEIDPSEITVSSN